MVIAENRLSTAALIPFRRDQCGRINFEMSARVIRNVFRGTLAADPAIAAKQDSAYFLRCGGKGQLLEIGQHRA
jgi:hypothetical protein